MQTIQLKNTTLAYEIYGDRKLPPILLIMGLGMPAAGWPKPFVQMLMKKGFRVILADNRDSGRSMRVKAEKELPSVGMAIGRALLRLPVQSAYTLEDMAIDYVELLEKLGLDSAHVAGASMGGMIAQVIATVAPAKVRSLIPIMSASGNPRTGFGKLKTIYTLFSPLEENGIKIELADYYSKVLNALKSPSYVYPEDVKKEMFQALSSGGMDPKGTERQLLAILASADRSEQLKRITAPTLVIHGEDDPLLPLSAGKELADLIPNAKLKVFKQMGHDLPPIHFKEMTDLMAAHAWQAEN